MHFKCFRLNSVNKITVTMKHHQKMNICLLTFNSETDVKNENEMEEAGDSDIERSVQVGNDT